MRLDRTDSYLTEFQAQVTDVREDERGHWLRLDRSAFYPTAGGQLHDTGHVTVAGTQLRVMDVQAADNAVWHLVTGAGLSQVQAGTPVDGSVDWQRRYRHMQRHTGQHLLSQALVRVDPAFATTSVSMRGPGCTIDFSGQADADALAAVEFEVNRATRGALAITAFEIDDSRLGEYQLRRPAKVRGQVRLVAIGDYDLVACGGTHLSNSAEALPLKIVGLERVKGGTNRLTFRAGEEAQEDYAAKHAAVTALGAQLSAPASELSARVERLMTEAAALSQRLAAARRVQAAALAQRLTASAEAGCAVAHLTDESAELFPELVDLLQQAPGTVALLAADEVGTGRVRFAFLAGPDTDFDVRPVFAALLKELGGRGGGRPDRAQGAAEADQARISAALAAAADQVKRALQ